MRLEEFRPSRFAESVVQVVRQHPTRTAGGLPEVFESDIDALRTALRPLKEWEVAGLAATVSVRRLHAGVALLTDDEVGEKAALVVSARPRASVLKEIWRRVRAEYPEPRVVEPFRQVAAECPWADVEAGFPLAPHLLPWLQNPSLAFGAQEEWTETAFSADCALSEWLEGLEIPAGAAFHNAVVRTWLHNVPAAYLRRVNGDDFAALIRKESKGVRGQAMAHYLNSLQRRGDWDNVILAEFLRGFDPPQPGGVKNQDRYWKPVDDEPRQEFRSWALGQRVAEYFALFEDKIGRGDFWRPFVEQHGVEVDLRCPVEGTRQYQAIGLEFPNFGVVEFREVNNAAYLYTLQEYRRIMSRQGDRVSLYKERGSTLAAPGVPDGRLQHHDGWQDRWNPRISQLMGA